MTPDTTVRDWFASQALVGLLGISQGPPSEFAKSRGRDAERVAEIAFIIADAMIAARNKAKSEPR